MVTTWPEGWISGEVLLADFSPADHIVITVRLPVDARIGRHVRISAPLPDAGYKTMARWSDLSDEIAKRVSSGQETTT